MTFNETKMLIIYGSQTGQSKSIAEDIASLAVERNYHIELLSMEDAAEELPWSDFNTLIVITSSTGDGDPPDNAIKLWKKLRSKDLNDQLSHLQYALLGLGDTNYTTFCGFPRAVDKQLLKLGARKIYQSAWADDAVGLETTVDPWIENLWSALEEKKVIVDSVPQCTEDNLPETERVSTFLEDMGVIKIPELMFPLEIVEDSKPVVQESLIKSPPNLQDCELKIPVLPENFLELTFKPELQVDVDKLPFQNNYLVPAAVSPIINAQIQSAIRLSGEKAAKVALEITVGFKEHVFEYQPGDTVGVVCPNKNEEVEAYLEKLGLLEIADVPYYLNVRQELVHLKMGNKPKYVVPPYLPNPGTLRHLLTHCCEIRSVPRKAMLRILAHYASNEQQKRRLLELCSLQGSEDYVRFLRQPNVNVLDLLDAFPSCRPPIERLLEHWPRLLPRPYSISSSPLRNPRVASFVFNVIEFPLEDGRSYARKGLATGWMQNVTRRLTEKPADVTESIEKLDISDNDITIPIFLRSNTYFRMPADTEKPLILIGPGTGVAPFIGFLQHREQLLKANPDRVFGPVWLLHGCRTQEHDFLYREELKRLHAAGIVTRLHVCFSRQHIPPQPRYVQDVINQHQSQIVKLILMKGGFVFVCGDANNMAKDVMNALTVAIQTVQGIAEDKAKEIVLQLQKDKRYLQDIWT